MSAASTDLLAISLKLAADNVAKRFVTATGAKPARQKNAVGVTQTDGKKDELVTVTVLGTAVVTAAAKIAAGTALEVDADGKVVPHTNGKVAVGRALTAAAADGDDIEVFIIPN